MGSKKEILVLTKIFKKQKWSRLKEDLVSLTLTLMLFEPAQYFSIAPLFTPSSGIQ